MCPDSVVGDPTKGWTPDINNPANPTQTAYDLHLLTSGESRLPGVTTGPDTRIANANTGVAVNPNTDTAAVLTVTRRLRSLFGSVVWG